MTTIAPANDLGARAEQSSLEAAPAPRRAKLSFAALGIYGSGALVENVTTAAIGSLLLFYLTIVCGLSGSYAGAALGATLVVDALIDPIVGSISDNNRSAHGRRHPLMIASIIPIVLTFGLLFSVPHGLSGLPLFGYALAALLCLRVAISFFSVPYMALGAELSEDYAERSSVVASRVFFTVIGGLVASLLIWGVFLKGASGRYNAAAYSPLAWTLGGIVALGALVSTLGTLRARARLHSAPKDGRFGLRRFFGEVAEVARSRSFVSLVIPNLILCTALGISGALALHANTFFWKLSSSQILLLGLIAPLGLFGGIFAANLLAKRMEKRTAAVIGLVFIGVAQLAPVTLRLSGLISSSATVPVLAVAGILTGLGGAIAIIAFQSMMADVADEHEHLSGSRREGLYFAGITLSVKASTGLGAWIGGIALDVIGFPHGASSAALPANIPAETIRNLGIAYGPGAAIFTAVTIWSLMSYNLTKADHARIQAELRVRRAESTR